MKGQKLNEAVFPISELLSFRDQLIKIFFPNFNDVYFSSKSYRWRFHKKFKI
jgi:hypothetical protein